ncbi:olfactomedin-4-like isoform X1 [Scomber scombrus]|uniref:Olfactomedin-4-like isoform X1 n=1 Tax=Scomber scombrus TaxID=13677 RepID=A0AAV1PE34_SCOSC
MKLCVIIPLCALITLTQQAPTQDQCLCDLTNSEKAFPHDKLSTVEDNASKCNSNITPKKTLELESLMLGLERRLPQMEKDLSVLEREDDGELYGVLSLLVIENELTEIKQLMDKLNMTSRRHQHLTTDTTEQLEDLRVKMAELQEYDTLQVVKRQQANQRLKRDLDQCKNEHHPTPHPTQPPQGICPHGRFLNITGPRIYTAGEYPGSYMYGAWGRDPKPEVGKENWYWLVMLTSSNIYANYVRLYSSLSSLIVGVSGPGNIEIHSSNPTTNTIQGPNVGLYGGALYYNCYNKYDVCRFNLTTKTVTTLQLPEGTRFTASKTPFNNCVKMLRSLLFIYLFIYHSCICLCIYFRHNSKGNFCNLDACYSYTDLDLATDESGVWVIYTTTQDFGNLVLSKVEEGEPPTLNQTWYTSVYKQAVTNTFMACGVLYATRHVSKEVEEIFYSFDTSTEVEKFNIGIFIKKMSPNIYSLNYSPVDQMLHAYCNSYMVSYKMLFG